MSPNTNTSKWIEAFVAASTTGADMSLENVSDYTQFALTIKIKQTSNE